MQSTKLFVTNFFDQVFVLIVSASLLGVNIWGSILMRQEFNPIWFIPKSTYLSQYFSVIENYYPDNGQLASIYIQTTNMSDNLNNLEALIDTVKNETAIVSRVDDWLSGFKEFTAKRHAISEFTKQVFDSRTNGDCIEKSCDFVDWTNPSISDEQFSTYLKNYLFTQKGAKFRSNFKFSEPLNCRSTFAPSISVFVEISFLRNLFQKRVYFIL